MIANRIHLLIGYERAVKPSSVVSAGHENHIAGFIKFLSSVPSQKRF